MGALTVPPTSAPEQIVAIYGDRSSEQEKELHACIIKLILSGLLHLQVEF